MDKPEHHRRIGDYFLVLGIFTMSFTGCLWAGLTILN